MHILEKLANLRIKGKLSEEIAKEVSLTQRDLLKKEWELRCSILDINPYDYSYQDLLDAAKRLDLSVFEAERILPLVKIAYSVKHHTPIEIRKEQIRTMIGQGAASTEEIALALNLVDKSIKFLWNEGDVELSAGVKGRVYQSYKERIRRIRELASIEMSEEEIANELGLKRETVVRYAKNRKIKIGSLGHPRKSKFDGEELIAQRARGYLENGGLSLEELCRTAKVGATSLLQIIKKHGIDLPGDLEPYRTKPELDELIEQGLSQTEIGRIAGILRESVRQYINKSGQYRLWEIKKEEAKKENNLWEEERKAQLSQVFSLLENLTAQKAREAGWAYEKAEEYINRRKANRYNYCFDDLVIFFKNYEKAAREEKRATHEELVIGTKINPEGSSMGKILERVGLSSHLQGKGRWEERQIISLEKKEAIRRSARLPIGCADTAYFLGLKTYIVGGNLRMWGISKTKKYASKPIKVFGRNDQGKRALTYRLASQIYEAHDANFTLEETCELLDTTREFVEYAVIHNRKIAPRIKRALKVLYPGREITNPYRTWK